MLLLREVEVYGRIAFIPMGPREYPEYQIFTNFGKPVVWRFAPVPKILNYE